MTKLNQTRKMRSRKIPIFKMVLKGFTYEKIKETPAYDQIRGIVLDELVIAIEDGIKKNKKSVKLFEIGDTDIVLELERSKWKQSLGHALQKYVNEEDYIRCVRIRNLMDQI